jgi:hypothetical protein
LYAEANQPATTGTGKTHQWLGVFGPAGNSYDIRVFNGTVRYAVVNTSAILGNDIAGSFDKAAFGYTQQSTFAQSGSVNGANAVSSTTAQTRTPDSLEIGSGSNNINGHIRKIAYYPRRLANSELVALTS